jgi:hypothetical protein
MRGEAFFETHFARFSGLDTDLGPKEQGSVKGVPHLLW